MVLSIIVPVYNVEKYLARCIESLVHQDIATTNYEIIMVNDGSTDHSKQIAELFTSKYQNVTLINQENQGLSGARNSGLNICRGRYVMFVDSDDYLEKNCLMRLVKLCDKEQLDICHFPLMVEHIDGSMTKDVFKSLTPYKIYNAYDVNKDGGFIGSVCSNIIKKKILEDYNLKFEVGITHEDVEFTTRLFCHANRVMLINSTVYYYMYNGSSLSKDSNLPKVNKYLFDSAQIVFLSKKYIQKTGIEDQLKKIIIGRINTGFIGFLVNLLILPRYSFQSVTELLNIAEDLGIYPVKGNFSNYKTKLFSFIFNNKKVYLYFYKFRSHHA